MLALFFCSALLLADEESPEKEPPLEVATVAEFNAYTDEWREERHRANLAAAEYSLKDLQSRARRGDKTLGQQIRTLKASVARMKREKPAVGSPTLLGGDEPMKKGRMGSLRANRFRIAQVIDDKSVLITPVYDRTYSASRGAVSPGQVRLTTEAVEGKTFLLRGVDASEWTDDSIVDAIPGNFHCIGTEQYQTVLGATRTVFLVMPIVEEPPQEKADAEGPPEDDASP